MVLHSMDDLVARPRSASYTSSHRKQPGKEASTPAARHPVLSRLMEEVRNERGVEAAYDRVHNRHNRGQ